MRSSLLLRKAAAQKAFTLTELLIAVAIIGVLASLLLPMMRSMANQAKVVRCIGNLQQMASALGSYAGDHQGAWPYPDDNRDGVINGSTTGGTWLRVSEEAGGRVVMRLHDAAGAPVRELSITELAGDGPEVA